MKKIQIIGLLLMLICSSVVKFKMPEDIQQKKNVITVTLEGEFLKTGVMVFEENISVKQIVKQIGITHDANKKCLNYDYELIDESVLYLPSIHNSKVSLNHSSKEELITLKGIGEIRAQKIIEYRNEHEFMCLEDIMNIHGIGEKTYMKLRDYICL